MEAANGFSSKSALLTDAMVEEDAKIQQKLLKEAEESAETQVSGVSAEERRDQIAKWLSLMLDKASLYSDYLFKQLEHTETDCSKKQGRKTRKRNSAVLSLSNESNSKGSYSKRLRAEAPSPSHSDPYGDVVLMSTQQPQLLEGGQLREYQLKGFGWLKAQYEHGINGILGDEMGLGKTIQFIALVCHLIEKGVSGPFLVVAPLSTVPNWVMEFRRFAPKVPVILYHGASKEIRRDKIKEIHKTRKVNGRGVLPVVVTSYEIAMYDRPLLQSFNWRYLVVDEGHRIKNMNCRLIRELKKLNTCNRLLLTGTPLQNNLSELWSLLNFLLPEIFESLNDFEAYFDMDELILSESSEDNKLVAASVKTSVLEKLHKILTPFLLRRLKADVELGIPPKREMVVYAPLTSAQLDFYKLALEKALTQLEAKAKQCETENESFCSQERLNSDQNCTRPRRSAASKANEAMQMIQSILDDECDEDTLDMFEAIFKANLTLPSCAYKVKRDDVIPLYEKNIPLRNLFMIMRKACNHPYLLQYPIDQSTGDYLVNEDIVKLSGKMMVLDCLVTELKSRGHKILLFSQWVKMLDILQDYFFWKGYKFCRLDGNMKIEDRQIEIKRFYEDAETFVFLISTRAGGLGINLVPADTVIIFDSDFNPQADLQAQDRCHRIGQTKPVVVYRLVTRNTIDAEIIKRATSKRRLEKMVIHQGKFKGDINNSRNALSAKELMELLTSRDYEKEVNAQSSDFQNDVISKKDLAMLLDRSNVEQKMAVKNVFEVINAQAAM